MPPLSLTKPRDIRRAYAFWGALLLVVTVLIAAGNERTVTPSYREASFCWFRGTDLYNAGGTGFIYLPQAAILFAPFAYLPQIPGEILWRATTILSFAWGVRRLAELAGRDSHVEMFPLMTIVSLPLTYSAARNGQATLLMGAMMMLTVADIAEARWWRATLWLSAGLAIKPLIVVLSLLAAALYRPLRWRLVLGTAVVLALPFCLQSPGYVIRQYQACVLMLRTAAQPGAETYWANVFGMLSVAGISVPAHLQTAVGIVCAVLTLVVCWIAQRRYSTARTGVFLYSMAACYLMLLNPRTENNTYALLGPAIAASCAQALLVDRRLLLAGGLTFVAVGVLGSYELGKWFVPSPLQAVWLAPLMCVCFCAYLICELRRAPEEADEKP